MKRALVLLTLLALAASLGVGDSSATVGTVNLTLSESSSYAYVSGTTLYYSANSGSFTVTASDSSPSSIAQVDFPSVTGMTGGGTVSSSPWQTTYAFTSSTAASGSQTVPVTDTDTSTGNGNFTVTPDTTGPSGVTVALSGGPNYSALSVPLTLGSGTDSGSGEDSSSAVVERATADLSGGSCGSFGSYATVTLSNGADTGVASGHCYRYRYTVSDNVGNSTTSSASADAKVDSGTPTVADTAPTESSGAGDQYWNSGTDTLWFRPAATGSFTLNATASDTASGITQVVFPDLSAASGWSGSGGTDTSSPYASPTTYTWSAGAAPPGAKRVTATSGNGLTASDTITIAADAVAPTGQTVALSGGPWYPTLSVPLTLVAGTDAGAGVDASRGVVERASAPLTNGVCGTFGDFAAVTMTGNADATVASGNCYRYQYKTTDNVGNVSNASKPSDDAKVDATPPSAPRLTFGSTSNTAAVGNIVYYRPGVAGSFTVTAASTDGDSGIASVDFPAIAGFAVTGAGASRTYWFAQGPAVPPAAIAVSVVNGAGLTSPASSFLLLPDTRAPVVSVRCNGAPCRKAAYKKAVTISFRAADGPGAGVETIRYTTNRTLPTLARGAVYRKPFAVRSLTHLRVRAYDRAGNASRPVSVTVRSLADRLVFSAPRRLNTSAPARYLQAKVSVSVHAVVTALLRGPGLKKPHRWRFALSSGKSIVRFTVPKAARRAGHYRLVWNVRAGHRKAKKVSNVYRHSVKKKTAPKKG